MHTRRAADPDAASFDSAERLVALTTQVQAVRPAADQPRQASRPSAGAGLGRKVEVDMVLEHASGTVIGLEVKAAETVRTEDFCGLRHLANRLGDLDLPGPFGDTGSWHCPVGVDGLLRPRFVGGSAWSLRCCAEARLLHHRKDTR